MMHDKKSVVSFQTLLLLWCILCFVVDQLVPLSRRKAQLLHATELEKAPI